MSLYHALFVCNLSNKRQYSGLRYSSAVNISKCFYRLFNSNLISTSQSGKYFNKNLCKDYHWWWRSFIVSGGSAVYVSVYSVFYFVTKVRFFFNFFKVYIFYFCLLRCIKFEISSRFIFIC